MTVNRQTKPAHPAKKSSANAAGRRSTARSSGSENEAIAQLTEDHARVKKMFKQYERLAKDEADGSERLELATTICIELTAHATAEEEIFYPAAREALAEPDLVDEAEVEHATAKELIAQIEQSSPDEPLFDAKMKVLGEYIHHHVQEEENEMFPKVRKAKVDTITLGERIAARKAEIKEELGAQMAEATK